MPLIFERSIDTENAINALRKVNGEVSYDELAARSHLSVKRLKQVLPSARRVLRKENILFGTIFGHGLKRLGDLEKAHASEAAKKRIGNTAKRALKDLDTIENFGALPNVEQLSVTTNRTIFHLVREHAHGARKAAPKG
jgi:hypothetical protein